MNNLISTLICSLFVLLTTDVFAQSPKAVVIAHAKQSNNQNGHWVAGKIVPIYESEIAAAAEGRLEYVATIGTYVKQGEIIASIDKFEVNYKLQQARKEYDQLKLKQEYAKAHMKRTIELSKSQNVSEDELMQLNVEHKVLTSQLEQAKQQISHFKQLLDRADLRAPFAGEISHINKNIGESVELHQSIVKMISHTNTEIALVVSAQLVAKIPATGQLNVKFNNQPANATIRSKYVLSKAFNHAYEVRLTTPHQWPIGSLVLVELPTIEPRNIVLPIDALDFKQDGVYVRRLNKDDSVEILTIEPISYNGQQVVVSGLLSPDDRVIIRGGSGLLSGQKVTTKSTMKF